MSRNLTLSATPPNTIMQKIVDACLPHLEGDSLGVPKYARLYNAITEAVRKERLKPGDKLPSEQVLAMRLPASLGTLQKALKALSDDGVVVRQHGRGTFIGDPQMKHEDIRVFRFIEQGRPLPLTLKGLGIAEIDIYGALAEFFEQERCAVVQRLLRVAGQPWTFNEFYLPLKLAHALLELSPAAFDGFSLHEYLLRNRNIATPRFAHRITVDHFSAAARQALGQAPDLDSDTSLGLIWQVRGYSRQGRPLTYQRFEMHRSHRPIELDTQVVEPTTF